MLSSEETRQQAQTEIHKNPFKHKEKLFYGEGNTGRGCPEMPRQLDNVSCFEQGS